MAINGFNAAIFQSPTTGVNQFAGAGGYNAGSAKQVEGVQPALRGAETYTMGNFDASLLNPNRPMAAQGVGTRLDIG
jgi:hypothetical protein